MTEARLRWWAWAALAALSAGAAAGCKDGQGLFGSQTQTVDPAEVPDSEGYTILLTSFVRRDHVRRAVSSKEKTATVTGWKDLLVVHEADRSQLYRGRYSTVKEAAGPLEAARRWRSPMGLAPFESAIVVKRKGEGVGPPEWDLASATGWYTVVVGEFFNCSGPDSPVIVTHRKELAVANCRDLRKQGYEAFYAHGPTKSVVTIGNFPRRAYRMEQAPDGAAIAVLVDENLKRIMKEWPKLAVNGYEEIVTVPDPKTGQYIKGPTGTYVTAISDYRGSATFPTSRPALQPQPRQTP